ncbi:uncharacterized protein TNCT_657831 [Trichonephila clavata]|uniref:Uncharacterized protein n=1 Tax=Trichonephila clavata TaxID=2740835 RepID=A0A8X6JN84_TRICU|nr:uncharacterized protein TNCT_657831 [Trichonephila clavata]
MVLLLGLIIILVRGFTPGTSALAGSWCKLYYDGEGAAVHMALTEFGASKGFTMINRKANLAAVSLLVIVLSNMVTLGEGSIYKMMADAMGWNDGWESKGITFGIKSKGMTAIIPIPLPIPIFTKEKKGGGSKGDSGGGDKGSGGGDKGGDKGGEGGGWETP